MLLKDFEKRENLLANKLMVKLDEKDDIEEKVTILIMDTYNYCSLLAINFAKD